MNQELSIQQLLRILRRMWDKRWLILVPGVLGGAAATAMAVSQPDIFRGEALLIAEFSTPSGGSVRRSEVARTREILSSVGERVYSDGFLLEMIEKHDLYPGMMHKGNSEAAIMRARKDLKVTAQGGKGVVKIQFDYDAGDDARQKAADAANHVSQYLVHRARDSISADSQTISEFYKKELQKATEQVRIDREALTKFRAKHEGSLPEHRETNQAEINSHQQTINLIGLKEDSLRDEVTDLEGELELARRALYEARVKAGADAELEPRRSELARLRTELVQMERTYTPTSKKITIMKERIRDLAADVKKLEEKGAANAPEDDPLVQYAMNRVERLEAQHARTLEELNNVDKTVQNARARIEASQARIARSYELQTEYQTLQEALQQAEEHATTARREYDASALTTRFHEYDQNVVLEVQQAATPKQDPVGPQRVALALIGLVAGMGLGGAYVFLRIQSDVTMRSREDLRPLLPAAILVSVPEIIQTRSRVWHWLGAVTLGGCLAVIFLASLGALGAKEGWWSTPAAMDSLIDTIKHRIANM